MAPKKKPTTNPAPKKAGKKTASIAPADAKGLIGKPLPGNPKPPKGGKKTAGGLAGKPPVGNPKSK